METCKEVQKITTEKIVTRTCDDCGAEIHWSLACSVARCEVCKKDLCDKCVAKEKSTMGDYREVYCGACEDLYNSKYKHKLDLLSKRRQTLLDSYYVAAHQIREFDRITKNDGH
jgi:hypothetical protein